MKLERLIGILAILLQREKVTAPALAELFEVSPAPSGGMWRPCARRASLWSPPRGPGAGISILEGYRVDRTLLTAPEMQAILAGLRSLDSVSGTRRYAQLMEKLSAGRAPWSPVVRTCSLTCPPGPRPPCLPRSRSSKPRWRTTAPSPSPTLPPKGPPSGRWNPTIYSSTGRPGMCGPGAGPGRTFAYSNWDE